MLDIMIARMTHVEWSDQLGQALQEKNTVLNVQPYNKCDLGTWLYNEALRDYGDIPEIELLERNHRYFHNAAERVVKWHNGPKISAERYAQAQQDFDEAQNKSKEIIYLLTMIEYKLIKNFQSHTEDSRHEVKHMLLHPIKTLNRLLNKESKKVNISKVSLDMLRQELHGPE